MSLSLFAENGKKNGATYTAAPLATSGNSYRSGRSPPEPYPATATLIINNFIIGDTSVYTKLPILPVYAYMLAVNNCKHNVKQIKIAKNF